MSFVLVVSIFLKLAERPTPPPMHLPSYMDGTTLSDGESYTPEVWWEGYDTKPLPGWMLNWQGYSAFHRVNYKCQGIGSIPSRQSETKVYGLVMYMKR